MTNSNKTFFSKRKDENFYKQAKKLNLRARSYFKIEHIDTKYSLIKPNMKILDLGCAPGAFLEYVDRKLAGKNFDLTGIDLLEIRNKFEFSEKIKLICDDFFNLKEHITDLDNHIYDLILCDMSPEFSGNQKMDVGRTHKLNLDVIFFAQKHLRTKGNLVLKTFFGEEYEKIKKIIKKNFFELREYKPQSSQKKSSEVFLICLKKI